MSVSMEMTETSPDFSGCQTLRIQKVSSLSLQDSPLWFNQFPLHAERYSASSSGKLQYTCGQRHKGQYVCDNVISRCDQETDIISYYQESRSIMNAPNFSLLSWASNGRPLREKAEQDQRADTSTVVNILGLRWHPIQDTLYLARKEVVLPSSQPTSKRDSRSPQVKISQPYGSFVVRQRDSSPLVTQLKATQTVYYQPHQRDHDTVPCYCLESLSNP